MALLINFSRVTVRMLVTIFMLLFLIILWIFVFFLNNFEIKIWIFYDAILMFVFIKIIYDFYSIFFIVMHGIVFMLLLTDFQFFSIIIIMPVTNWIGPISLLLKHLIFLKCLSNNTFWNRSKLILHLLLYLVFILCNIMTIIQ